MPSPLENQAAVSSLLEDDRFLQAAEVRKRKAKEEALKDPRGFFTKAATAPLDFVSGVASGVLKDPLLNVISPPHLLYNAVAGVLDTPGTKAIAAQIDAATAGRTLADVGRLVGELAPGFAVGGGLFTLGKAAAVRALQVTAPRLAQLAEASMARQLAQVSARAGGANALGLGMNVAKPAIERAAEVAGGSLGISVLGGAEQAVRDGDTRDIVRGAALAGALSVGTEVGLMGAARLFGRGKEILPHQVEDRFSGSEDVQSAIAEIQSSTTSQLKAAGKRVASAVNAKESEEEILRVLEVTPPTTKKGIAKLARQTRKVTAATDALFTARHETRDVIGGVKAVRELVNPRNPVPSQYTSLEPYNPDGRQAVLAHIFLKGLQTPEGFLRNMGVSGTRFLNKVVDAEHELSVSRSVTSRMVERLKTETADLMGVGKLQARNGKYLMPLVSAYETGGLAGVRAYFPDAHRGARAVKVFEEIESLGERYASLAKLGALPPMDGNELRTLGVRAFFPHVLAHKTEEQMFNDAVALLVKNGTPRGQAEVKVARSMTMGSDSRRGLSQFASQVHRRDFPGTLESKLGSGLYEENPLVALERYSIGLDRSLAYGKRFGFSEAARQKTRDSVVALAAAEGGSTHLMRTVVDEMLFDKYHSQALRQMAQGVSSLEAFSKLTFAVLSNVGGSANTVLLTGLRNFGKGVRDMTRSPAQRNQLSQVLALNESLFQSMRRSYAGQSLVDSAFDRLADVSLKYTGFSAVERFNRLWAGSSASHMIQDTTARAVSGRLRGEALNAARRRFLSLSLDLDKVHRVAREAMDGGADFQTALYRAIPQERMDQALFEAVKMTQFVPDVTRRPIAWNHPVGRLMTQFKSFSLNQGRFLRDQVLHEAAIGNPAPLAYFIGMYPVVGELIRESQFAAKGTNRPKEDGIGRYLNDVMSLGAFGLAQSVATGLRYGDVEGVFLGPAFSDAASLGEALYASVASERGTDKLKRFVDRQPVTRATRRLLEAPATMFRKDIDEYAAAVAGDEEPQTMTSEEVLRSVAKAHQK